MKIQSYSDIITNSSSELFVFENEDSIEDIVKTLDEIYPNWKSEYLYPEKVKDAEYGNLETLVENEIYYISDLEEHAYCESHGIKPWYDDGEMVLYDTNLSKDDFDKSKSVAIEFAKKLGSTPEKVFSNWDVYNPFASWADEEDFGLEKHLTISLLGMGLYQEKYGEYTMLWSLDENPNWDYQEKLMKVATRYHLG